MFEWATEVWLSSANSTNGVLTRWADPRTYWAVLVVCAYYIIWHCTRPVLRVGTDLLHNHIIHDDFTRPVCCHVEGVETRSSTNPSLYSATFRPVKRYHGEEQIVAATRAYHGKIDASRQVSGNMLLLLLLLLLAVHQVVHPRTYCGKMWWFAPATDLCRDCTCYR